MRLGKKFTPALFTLFIAFSGLFFFYPAANVQAEPREDLFDMSIEELMNIEIESSSSLTRTTRKLQPSTVTTITREQIRASGARSLDELLDIYVPNLQILRSENYFQSMGVRGIMSINAADKLLILVNGKEINEHTNYGAISERDLPLLTDIHHIDVVRGPGSALYGVGALACVINIITESAETFEGQQVTLRTGQIEEFYSAEYKMGKKFKDDSGLYIYTGVARNYGSDEDYSPMISPYPRAWGYVRDQMGYRDNPKYKIYFDYTTGPFGFWGRYTRGGTRFDTPMSWTTDPYVHTPPFPPNERFSEHGYQQLMLGLNYTLEFSDRFKVDTSFSYDMFDIELYFGSGVNCSREDKYTTKLVATWTPNDEHSFAFGASHIHEKFGKRSPGYPGDTYWWGRYNPGCMSMIRVGIPWIFWDANGWCGEDANRMPKWTTETYSFFGEHQWKISDKWTNFFGMRIDKNTFTDYMFSPRDTLIFTPTDKDTLKFMFSRAQKLNFASEMYVTMNPPGYWWLSPANPPDGKRTKPEVLYAYELRYERQHTKSLWLAGSFFFHDHDIRGYTGDVTQQAGAEAGNMKTYGIEFEGIYKKGKTELIFSHSYTKLYDFDADATQSLTSEPYGYGKNLNNWSNHQTKLIARRQVNDKVFIDGSLRILWGHPGTESYNEYLRDITAGYAWAVPASSGSIFHGNMKLNLGLTYKHSEDLQVRLDGYNLLGLLDDDFNQNLVSSVSARSSAPALGITITYKF